METLLGGFRISRQTKAALDILAAVADGPEGGMKLQEVVRLINDIADTKELVALTVAEPMPRLAIRLKAMLASLPLM